MSNIPTLTPCRFTTLKEIVDSEGSYPHKSIRIMGKLVSFDLSAYSATISNEGVEMKIDIHLIPEKELIIKNKYEFLGDLKTVSI